MSMEVPSTDPIEEPAVESGEQKVVSERMTELRAEAAANRSAVEQYNKLRVHLENVFGHAKLEATEAINALEGKARGFEDEDVKGLSEELAGMGKEFLETLKSKENWAEKDARSAEIEISVREELGPNASDDIVKELTENRKAKEFGWD